MGRGINLFLFVFFSLLFLVPEITLGAKANKTVKSSKTKTLKIKKSSFSKTAKKTTSKPKSTIKKPAAEPEEEFLDEDETEELEEEPETEEESSKLKFTIDFDTGAAALIHKNVNKYGFTLSRILLSAFKSWGNAEFKIELALLGLHMPDRNAAINAVDYPFNTEYNLRQAYVLYAPNIGENLQLTFKVGKMLVTWGKVDEFRPVDVINAEDKRFFMWYLKDDRKIGDWAGLFSIQYNTIESAFGVELIGLPLFQPTLMPEPGSPFYPKTNISGSITVDTKLPSTDLKYTNAGAKVFVNNLAGIDFDLYTFYGFKKEPVNHMIFNIVPFPPYFMLSKIEMIYPQIHLYGADMETVIPGIDTVFRFEGAYITGDEFYIDKDKVPQTELNSVLSKYPYLTKKQDYLSYVVAFEKDDLVNNLDVVLQYMGRYILDYYEYLSDKEMSHSIALILNYKIGDKVFKDRFKFNLIGVYWPEEMAYVMGTALTFKAAQNTSLILGVFFLEDLEDDDSFISMIEDSDMAFIRAQIKF